MIAISHYTRDRLIEFGVDAARIAVVYPGAPRAQEHTPAELDAARRRYGLEGKRVVLAVGRLIHRKGHLTLVRAMRQLSQAHSELRLVVVGRGPMEAAIHAQIHALDLRESVLMTGYVSDEDVARLFDIAEVFALPTGEDESGQVEGFGLVFAEAHAYGKPVVAGRSGGAAEAVIDGETGILVAPDRPEAVADAIQFLLSNPDRARAMGDAGRRRIEAELNWRTFAQRALASVEAPV